MKDNFTGYLVIEKDGKTTEVEFGPNEAPLTSTESAKIVYAGGSQTHVIFPRTSPLYNESLIAEKSQGGFTFSYRGLFFEFTAEEVIKISYLNLKELGEIINEIEDKFYKLAHKVMLEKALNKELK